MNVITIRLESPSHLQVAQIVRVLYNDDLCNRFYADTMMQNLDKIQVIIDNQIQERKLEAAQYSALDSCVGFYVPDQFLYIFPWRRRSSYGKQALKLIEIQSLLQRNELIEFTCPADAAGFFEKMRYAVQSTADRVVVSKTLCCREYIIARGHLRYDPRAPSLWDEFECLEFLESIKSASTHPQLQTAMPLSSKWRGVKWADFSYIKFVRCKHLIAMTRVTLEQVFALMAHLKRRGFTCSGEWNHCVFGYI